MNNLKKIQQMALVFLVVMMMLGAAVLASSSAEAEASGENQKVRFGVMSDIHLGYTDWTGAGELSKTYSNEERFKNTLNWYAGLEGEDKVDAVALAGDITDLGEESEWQDFFSTIKGRLWAPHRDVKAAAAGKDLPVLVPATGNHDAWSLIHPWGNDGVTLNDFTGLANNEDRVINGYHFITVGSGDATDKLSQNGDDPYSVGDRWYSKGKTDTTGDVFSPQIKQWLRERIDNAKREDPNKPIFVIMHWPVKNTFLASDEWGTDSFGDNPSNYFFKDDPQVVVVGGHIHTPNQDPRSIWQMENGFTSVNTVTLNYIEMGNTDGAYNNPPPKERDTLGQTTNLQNTGGYSGGYVGRNGDASGTDSHPKGAVDGAMQGLIVEADGSRVTITNYDFDVFGGPGAEVQKIPQTWTFDVSPGADRPYTVENRKTQATAPVWPDSPKIRFDSINANDLTITFDQAVMPAFNPGNEVVHSYRIELWGINPNAMGDTSKTLLASGAADPILTQANGLRKRVKQWSDFMMPPNRQKATYTQKIAHGIGTNSFEVRIYPYSSFQKAGQPIIRRFTGGQNPDSNSSDKGYALSFNGNLNNSIGVPANVSVVKAINPKTTTETTAASPFYAMGYNGKQAVRLGYDGNGNNDANNVNALIDLGQADAFNYNQDFTVAFRTKIRRASVEQGTGRWPQLMSNMDFASYDNYGFSFFLQDGYIKLNAVAGNTKQKQLKVASYQYSESVNENNAWIHVAAVFDKTSRRLRYYANGVKVGDVALDLSAGINTGHKTYLGQSYNSSKNIFTGQQGPFNNGSAHGDWISFYMQDFLMQQGAMTDAQIRDLYQNGM